MRLQRLPEPVHGKSEDEGAEREEGEELLPEDSDSDSLEEDAADDDEVVAERVEEGEIIRDTHRITALNLW